MTVYTTDTINTLKERYGENLEVTELYMKINGYCYTEEEYKSAFQRTDKDYIKKKKIGEFSPNWMETYTLEKSGSHIVARKRKYFSLNNEGHWVQILP